MSNDTLEVNDAECWKLNRMRQLEDENIDLLKRISELEAELKVAKEGVFAQSEFQQLIVQERERELIREGFYAGWKARDRWTHTGRIEVGSPLYQEECARYIHTREEKQLPPLSPLSDEEKEPVPE